MGRLTQASKEIDTPEHNLKPLKITQWKIIRIKNPEDMPGIEVLVDVRLWFIHNITLDVFNQINHTNSTSPFVYEYKNCGLICEQCSGNGIVDWINKVTPNEGAITIRDFNNSYKYIRNKRGPVKKITTLNGETIYKSTPKIRIGEEYCPACDGCGIRLHEVAKLIEVVFFDEC